MTCYSRRLAKYKNAYKNAGNVAFLLRSHLPAVYQTRLTTGERLYFQRNRCEWMSWLSDFCVLVCAWGVFVLYILCLCLLTAKMEYSEKRWTIEDIAKYWTRTWCPPVATSANAAVKYDGLQPEALSIHNMHAAVGKWLGNRAKRYQVFFKEQRKK